MAAADESNMPFIRNLASSDRKLRTSALESLRTFLSAAATSHRLTPLDNLKLWKGLYYSLWMCDRPIPQQNLAAELAGLLDVLPDDAVGPWLCAFWEILGREWTNIDVYRLEKFLLLVRRVLGASLAWGCALMADSSSNAKTQKRSRARADAVLEVLGTWPLETENNLSRVPVGLRLHVLDIWVDEAEKLGLADPEQTSDWGREFLDRLGLLIEAQTKSTCKPVRLRARESLEDERLPWNAEDANQDSSKERPGDKDSWDGFED
ncbi:nucleolar protein,Nop52-domain-containing protein [Xylariaceae sp. FL0255]|nr:nucleolar protein,Nop52-domain-containing protein [Xylariaceae sp. FL0255]